MAAKTTFDMSKDFWSVTGQNGLSMISVIYDARNTGYLSPAETELALRLLDLSEGEKVSTNKIMKVIFGLWPEVNK